MAGYPLIGLPLALNGLSSPTIVAEFLGIGGRPPTPLTL